MPTPSDNTQLPRVQLLFSIIRKLPSEKQSFASDLINNFRRWGKLSTSQMEWVEKLILLATAPPQEARPEHLRQIQGFKVVEDLLYHAGEHVKFPCIRLQTTKGQKLELRPRRNERGVKVQVNGGAFGVVREEMLDMTQLRFLGDYEDVLNVLYEMAAHPVETAILYARKTKACCFCGIVLTAPESIAVGYGPICAENYGLPWGETRMTDVSIEELEALLEAQEHG